MNDPTKEGLSISPETPVKYRDIFDKAYQTWCVGRSPEEIAVIASYLLTARTMFTKNQPIAQDFMGATLSLRFQDGSVLPVCDAPGTELIGGDAGSIHVAALHPGKGKTVNSGSWGVTGDQP